MSLQERKEELNSYYKFWLKNKDTWIFAAIIFPISIGMPLYFFGDVDLKGDITLFEILIPFIFMAVLFFFIFSFDQASYKWRRTKEKNKFLENLINGDPVSVGKATGKYRHIIVDEFKSDDTIKVRTKLGDQKVKVGDLPDHTVNISFNPIEIFNELKDE